MTQKTKPRVRVFTRSSQKTIDLQTGLGKEWISDRTIKTTDYYSITHKQSNYFYNLRP